MITSTRYDSIATALRQQLPDLRPRLEAPLVLALTGMSQAVSAAQRAVAHAMPLATKQQSKIPRFRRLLDTETLTPERVYQPIVQQALHGVRNQRVQVILDRVVLTSTLHVLVVSVGFRRRSIPLAWQVLPHSGSSGLADQQTLLTTGIALLPPKVRITVQADSEFRSQELFAWIRDHGWDAMLGMRGTVLVTSDPATHGRPLRTWVPNHDTVAYLSHVYVTTEQHGPVQVMAWWSRNDRREWIVYGVMTNLPATWKTYRLGSRRMWIETVFRDWQRGGFGLNHTKITSAERFTRLAIIVSLVYLWFVSLGRWIVKRGYRSLLDAGPAHAWQASLFTLAIAWQNRCRSLDQSMPVIWFLYP